MSEPSPIPESRPANSVPAVDFEGVSHGFRDRHGDYALAVDQVTLQVRTEEFVALLGPSGCGKSTLLNMAGGALVPEKGTVSVFGKKVEGDVPTAVTVHQAYTCFPWLNVLGNVEFGLKIQGVPKADRLMRAADYLKRVDLLEHAHKRPRELSGGMQQRVALARTLVMAPLLILMDEPFGALDAQTRRGMQELLLSLWQEKKTTVLFVTHDIEEALLLADRIVVLSKRPARVHSVIEVPFSRPRGTELEFDPRFAEMRGRILELLKGD